MLNKKHALDSECALNRDSFEGGTIEHVRAFCILKVSRSCQEYTMESVVRGYHVYKVDSTRTCCRASAIRSLSRTSSPQ